MLKRLGGENHDVTVRGEQRMTMDDTPSPVSGKTAVIRISRGATAMATDAALGAVHQIIMDQRTGELQAIVIATNDQRRLEIPAAHVVRATGSTVYLDVSQSQLQEHPELARPYNPDQYVPVRENPFLAPSEARRGATFSERPVVTTIEHDAVGVVVPQPSTRTADMIASMTRPETETYISQPQPQPPTATPAPAATDAQVSGNTEADTSHPGVSPLPPSALTPTAPLVERHEIDDQAASIADEATMPTHSGPFPPSSLTRTAPLIEHLDVARSDETPESLDASSDAPLEPVVDASPVSASALTDDSPAAQAVPIITPGRSDGAPLASPSASSETLTDGPDNAAHVLEFKTGISAEAAKEDATMEGSPPPVDPVHTGAMSDTVHNDEQNVSDQFSASQQTFTRATPPEELPRAWAWQNSAYSAPDESGSRLSWVPAVALGTVIVGVAAWSAYRTIRRGRRKAREAAQNARISAETLRSSMLDSVRDAGRSAVEVAQSMRAGAQEIAANPRDTAADALSNLSDIPARYRWFRRGMRVGMRASQLRRRKQ
jgi:hypothetical protein